MIRVSHEVPICLLEESRNWNDYDYALVHLFDIHEEYYDFYKESLKLGRKVLLDNSIFELGTAFDSEKFADYVEKLKPTEYVVPDCLENIEQTISNFEKFTEVYNLPGIKIGVIQGKTRTELIECYNFMKSKADKIAIGFDLSYYREIAENYCEGRKKFVDYLYEMGIIDVSKPHHLLGAQLPQEFRHYKKYSFIDSLDTSNPVVHGIKEVRYTEDGLNFKIKDKLADMINIGREEFDIENVIYNINKFKEINFR